MGGMAEPDRAQAWGEIPGGTAEEIAPERQVFGDAERGLQRVAVTEIMGLLGQGQLSVAAVEVERSGRRRQQPRDQPQQRGFARSVGTGNSQRLTGGRLEIEAHKHLAAAAYTTDLTPREPHLFLQSPLK